MISKLATAPAFRFPVPLTLASALGQPGQVRAIPRVYGTKWVAGVPTQDPFSWIIAGHHLAELNGISGNDTSGRALAEAQLINTIDPDGRPISVARLPQQANGTPLFLVRGKSGNPADILFDLMGEVAGLPVTRSQFAEFGQQTAHIELAGRVDDPTKTLRATIDEVILNAGARWSRWMNSIAIALPITTGPVRHFKRGQLFNVQPEMSLDTIANRIRVLYDSGQPGVVQQRQLGATTGSFLGTPARSAGFGPIAADGYRQLAFTEAPSGELESSLLGYVPGSIDRHGVIEATLELRWVTTTAQAARVLQLALDSRSRPLFRCTAECDLDIDLQPGDVITADDPHMLQLDGGYLIGSANPDIAGNKTQLAIEASVGPSLTQVIEFPTPESKRASFFPGFSVGVGAANETVTEPGADAGPQGQSALELLVDGVSQGTISKLNVVPASKVRVEGGLATIDLSNLDGVDWYDNAGHFVGTARIAFVAGTALDGSVGLNVSVALDEATGSYRAFVTLSDEGGV